MKKKEKGFLPVIYLSFLLLFPSLCRADQISLRVLVPNTEIHLRPDSKSAVIISVPAGTILESTKQIKEWFELKLPSNKDGFVIMGYVHSSKVEIWTEKQVKEKPVKRKPVTPPPVKVVRTVPPIKPVSKEPKLSNGSKIGFDIKLHSGAGYLKGGDINAHIQSMNDYWSDLNYINVSGGEFKPFHLGMEFGGEIVIMFSPKIGIGVGVGYLQASKESTVESTLSNTDFTDTFNPKISIIPLSLNLHFGLPLGEKLKLKIFSGMGYYLGTVNWNYNYDSLIGDEQYKEVWQGKSNAFGYQGGLGIEFKITPGIAFVVEGCGRYLKLDDLSGDLELDASWLSGTETLEDVSMWYYELNPGNTGNTYPRVGFFNEEPSLSSYNNVRKGVVDLSGISVRIGIKIKLK